MKKTFLAATALMLTCGSANAITFDFTFLADGDVTPGGALATNINDYVGIGTGSIEVDDTAATPNGFVTFASGAITAFNASIVDNLGVTLTYDLLDDANNFMDDNFGVRFDDFGNFARFDTPDFSLCSGCFFIFDDEFPAPSRTTQGAGLMIVDEEPRFGFLTEDVMRFGTNFAQGDVVLLSDFVGAPVRTFGNTFTVENSIINTFASGFILAEPRGVVVPPPGPGPSVSPVPLPAGMPLLIGGVALLGWIGRKKRT